MDFFIKYLSETVEAINKLDNGIITVRKIRRVQNITSSNCSRINFIWRSLSYLVERNVLEENGSQRPKSYKKKTTDIDLEKIVTLARKERSNLNRIYSQF